MWDGFWLSWLFIVKFHSLSPLLGGVLGGVVQSDFLGCLFLSFIHYHGWKGMVE